MQLVDHNHVPYYIFCVQALAFAQLSLADVIIFI